MPKDNVEYTPARENNFFDLKQETNIIINEQTLDIDTKSQSD